MQSAFDPSASAVAARLYRNLSIVLAEGLRLANRWITVRPPL
jgi:hypothetical protein